VGYLGLMILLDERQEVLMLVTNSLKNDLNSRNPHIVGLALTALGNICSAEMARDLAPEVEKLLASANPYIRKKAALCARRVLRKVPDQLEAFVDAAAALLTDRNHAVILAGATLMLDIADQERATVAIFRDQVPLLCRILRALLTGGFSAEYDVGGIADPFLQVKILRLLRVLGAGSADASDQMSDVLAQVATNTEGARSAGNAILYECVRTIMAVESIGGLRVLAVNTLGRFLSNRDNNIRYVALTTLARVVAVDAAAVQRHRATVVDCVKDADASIRRKALELVYALVNPGNVRTLAAELLDYLQVCDPEFKADLTDKVCQLAARHAPDARWHVDALVRALEQAGPHVKEEACRHLAGVILNAGQLHGYAARALFRALRDATPAAAAPALVRLAAWCVGEYGELVVSGQGRLEGEAPLGAVTEGEVVGLLEAVLAARHLPPACAEHALTALAKLSARFPGSAARVRAAVAAHAGSARLEVQSRSVEYSRLFEFDAIRPQVLEHMPAMEEAAYDAALDATDGGGGGGGGGGDGGGGAVDGAASAAADLAALLGLDVGPAAADGGSGNGGGGGGAAAALDGMAALQDLLGGAAAAPAAATMTAYAGEAVTVAFALRRAAGGAGAADILATYTNNTAEPIASFSLQAAVPKFMTVRLDPASGSTLPPRGAGALTQGLHVSNSMHGQKALAMRLRMTYVRGGQQETQQCEVAGFPDGF
jgi:AP-1 complex subunit gamma-1